MNYGCLYTHRAGCHLFAYRAKTLALGKCPSVGKIRVVGKGVSAMHITGLSWNRSLGVGKFAPKHRMSRWGLQNKLCALPAVAMIIFTPHQSTSRGYNAGVSLYSSLHRWLWYRSKEYEIAPKSRKWIYYPNFQRIKRRLPRSNYAKRAPRC